MNNKIRFFLIIIISHNLFISNINSQTPTLDSLLNLLPEYPNDSTKVDLLNSISRQYYSVNLEKTIEFAQSAIDLSNEINYNQGLGTAYKHKGNSNYFKANYIDAYELYQKALESYEKAYYLQGIATIYRNFGSVFSQLGKYDKTIDNYKKSINIYIEIGDSINIANLYRNIGLYYQNLEDYKVADEYFTKALVLCKKIDNVPGIAETYFYKGSLFLSEMMKTSKADSLKYDSVSKNLINALNIYKSLNDTRGLARTSESLAIMYNMLQEPEKSLPYIIESQKLYNEMGAQLGYANTLNLHASYFLSKKQYNKAIEKLNEAEIIAKEIESKELLKEIYEIKSDVYYTKHDYKNSRDYLQLHFIYKDSLIRADELVKAAQMQSQFDFEEQLRQREAEEMQRQLEQEARLNRQKIVTVFFVIGFALMIVLAIVIFRSLKQKKAANILLEDKNQQLKQQQEEILVQNEMLLKQKEEILKQNQLIVEQQEELIRKEKLASVGKLTKGIVDRLINPLNYINNFSSISKEFGEEIAEILDEDENIKTDIREEVDEVLETLNSNMEKISIHGKSATLIVKGMEKLLREKSNKYYATNINILLKEATTSIINQYKTEVNENEFDINVSHNFDDTIEEIDILPYEIEEVIKNIIHNTCYTLHKKFSDFNKNYQPEIIITTKKQGNNCKITIKDNGTGMPQSELTHIFEPFFTTKPTSKGIGLGLYIVEDIIKIHKGTILAHSKENEYTEFVIELPVSNSKNSK